MNESPINLILLLIILGVVCGIALLRESPKALDALTDWAQARSWGLKCARVERDRRKHINAYKANIEVNHKGETWQTK